MADDAEIPLFTDASPVAIVLDDAPTNVAPDLRVITATDFTSDAAEALEPRRSI
jgi:hypothetical protein